MKSIILFISLMFTLSAFAQNSDLSSKFPILGQQSAELKDLKFLSKIGENTAEAKRVAEAIVRTKNNKWNEVASAICFNELSTNTMTGVACADLHLDFIIATAANEFKAAKMEIRKSKRMAATKEQEQKSLKILQNLMIARFRLAEIICDLSTYSWIGGSGHGEAHLGCQSADLKNRSDIQILYSLINVKDESIAFALKEEFASFDTMDQVLASLIVKSIKYENPSDLESADTYLNRQYTAAKNYLASVETDSSYIPDNSKDFNTYLVNLLKAQQLAWIDYRDAYCQAQAYFLFPKASDYKKYAKNAKTECLSNQSYKQASLLSNVAEGKERELN